MPNHIIDHEELKHLYGDDDELIADMFQLYREKSGAAIDYFEQAMKGGVASDIQLAAHRLKGVFASIGATQAKNAALALEKSAATGSTDGVGPLAEALRSALRAVELELRLDTTR